jgi:hypothetical protein
VNDDAALMKEDTGLINAGRLGKSRLPEIFTQSSGPDESG